MTQTMSSIDPSKLSREQKLELIELLEEREKRERKKRPPFKPHSGQLRVILSEKLERYLFCGNGFGKSTVLVNEVHWAAMGFNPFTKKHSPVPAKMLLVIDTPEKIDEFLVEYRKWNELDPDWTSKGGRSHTSFIEWPNGSTLTVVTHQVEPLKLEGRQWTHIFMDEPPPKPVFTGVTRGGRIKGRECRVLLAGTPITAAWMRLDIYEPWAKGQLDYADVFTGASDENAANLDSGWFTRFFGKLSEHEKAVRRLGQFHDLEGLALAHLWNRTSHTIRRADLAWEDRNPCVIVMDPHPSKAHHAIVLGADRDNRLYVLEEYKEKAIARKFAKSLVGLGWFQRYRVLDIVYDSLGSAETTSGEGFRPFGEVFNEVMEQHNLGHARATTYEEKGDEDFIDRIQDALSLPEEADNFGQVVPKLRVVTDCIGTISDIENVQWKRDRNLDENKPALEISNRDFLACLKYALACNVRFNKTKERAFYRTDRPYNVAMNERRQARRQVSLRRQVKRESSTDDDW
jgi:hypothetical protein